MWGFRPDRKNPTISYESKKFTILIGGQNNSDAEMSHIVDVSLPVLESCQ